MAYNVKKKRRLLAALVAGTGLEPVSAAADMSTNELPKIFRNDYCLQKFSSYSRLEVLLSQNGSRLIGEGLPINQLPRSTTNGPTLNTKIMCINSGSQIRGHANISFSKRGRPQNINIKLHTTEKAASSCLLF